MNVYTINEACREVGKQRDWISSRIKDQPNFNSFIQEKIAKNGMKVIGISQDGVDALIELAKVWINPNKLPNRWSRKHTKCISCGTTETPHVSHGLCMECHKTIEVKYHQRYRDLNGERITSKKKLWYHKHWKKNLAKHKVNRDLRYFGGNREKVLQRDDHKCCLCGNKFKLTVHHIDNSSSRSNPELANNKMINLITTCRQCHRIIHWYTRNKDLKIGQSFETFIKKHLEAIVRTREKSREADRNDLPVDSNVKGNSQR